MHVPLLSVVYRMRSGSGNLSGYHIARSEGVFDERLAGQSRVFFLRNFEGDRRTLEVHERAASRIYDI
ncbi:hypothetical protein NDU88_005586 [Pleurodeles waltl]|uniref:Uncharacterized protein n=1 Tax=Pleurodeles waltl TaxID=8319 RepID=A0AAV7RJ00_PLEWA|nr:hypothetical protein NDU88_005586 [Pleurodeles waltl]